MIKNIVLLGDSITQGLGSKKINFTSELQSLLGVEIFNMACTGTTIDYVDTIKQDILNKNPDIIIMIYGNVDAQIRPNRNGYIFKRLPYRFQKGGMLMPRPFYSDAIHKKLLQKLDNFIRFIFNKLIFFVDGSEQWLDIETFKNKYKKVLLYFLKENIKVVICSTVYIDDRKFKGTLSQYKKFNEELKKISAEYGLRYVDLFTLLKKHVISEGQWGKYYCNDHFHPNELGYKIIAKELSREIKKGE